ncbi:DUF433 domain-containing protein [Flavobacterium nackdongense]|uniref:DUF433 domain-containing protein n=1 Tax=Flavobacterium nackdongense TaxID=2547394 RepID=A0A4P6YI47_9FLAO|nr:DUF433 domain-containing protein [Flavobacterium nackdongense]
MDYKQYITLNSDRRFGKPIIIRTRITVFDVLNWLANGMTINEIIEDFPELNETQIKACLFYAADNKLNIIFKLNREINS